MYICSEKSTFIEIHWYQIHETLYEVDAKLPMCCEAWTEV